MKKVIFVLITLAFTASFISCSRGISPEQAAKGRQKCGKSYLR